MEELIELLKQIQELAGTGIEALQGALSDSGGGEKPEGKPGGPPEGGKPEPDGDEGGRPGGPPRGKGGPPEEEPPE